jgi:hypothetical protein
MKLIHPSDIAVDVRRIIWGKIPNKILFKLELIDFLNPRFTQYAKGGYMDVAAVSTCDMPEFMIEKGEHLIVQFAYKTFIAAFYSLPISMKKECSRSNMEPGDNLYIEFIKIKDKMMDIIVLRKVQGTKENVQIAKDNYDSCFNFKNKEDIF